ncbi:hypothetical protein AC578_9519 [Pseudocercospora eumusae]|uniref:WSC domain-containing protein n=1 Tax=Pseudocercospora eumusae TaxID=321146 RepID=A0A139HG73_9PEZI|nr:hypothetical protein AC578_9519 [Pseudocercospora eumusae]
MVVFSLTVLIANAECTRQCYANAWNSPILGGSQYTYTAPDPKDGHNMCICTEFDSKSSDPNC